jgi:hypothetical protein
LSDCKYQVIRAPIEIEKTKHLQFLGKSEKGIYLATMESTCQLRIWSLTESSGRIDWVLKHDIDLEPLVMASLQDLRDFDKTWTIGDDNVYCYYNYYNEDEDEEDKGEEEDVNAHGEVDEEQEDGDNEWNSDDDNVLNIEDLDTDYNFITFLGFHPYKEVVFLGLKSFVGVAYHLKSSKVQYLGKMDPIDRGNLPTNAIYKSFPYTPCMIGELLKHASEGPCR